MAENAKARMRKDLDPLWKEKLTACLADIGMMLDKPMGQIVLHVRDYRVSEADKNEKVR